MSGCSTSSGVRLVQLKSFLTEERRGSSSKRSRSSSAPKTLSPFPLFSSASNTLQLSSPLTLFTHPHFPSSSFTPARFPFIRSTRRALPLLPTLTSTMRINALWSSLTILLATLVAPTKADPDDPSGSSPSLSFQRSRNTARSQSPLKTADPPLLRSLPFNDTGTLL